MVSSLVDMVAHIYCQCLENGYKGTPETGCLSRLVESVSSGFDWESLCQVGNDLRRYPMATSGFYSHVHKYIHTWAFTYTHLCVHSHANTYAHILHTYTDNKQKHHHPSIHTKPYLSVKDSYQGQTSQCKWTCLPCVSQVSTMWVLPCCDAASFQMGPHPVTPTSNQTVAYQSD